jgi:hypothetical protein
LPEIVLSGDLNPTCPRGEWLRGLNGPGEKILLAKNVQLCRSLREIL